MPYANLQDAQPTVIDIGEITRHFFEHSPINASKGYELLSDVSDDELEIFDFVIKETDLATQPGEGVWLSELQSKSSDRRVLIKAARYDDQRHPIIAMAVFDMNKSTAKHQAIESFALFANETGEGFTPIRFQTHTVA